LSSSGTSHAFIIRRIKEVAMERYLQLAVIVLVLALAGCATQRPVLYPNAKLKQVGNEAAQRDIDECIQLAKESGVEHSGGEKVAKRGAAGAIVGGAIGAGVGAVRGDIGRSAAAGAAGGAAGGAASGAIQSGEPDSVYKGFVQRCLRERGYDVIGWK
jgi:uncharacterized protein YcfJ